ncbi:MAG: DUF3726 domain-containing protein [Pseudomonadota bacterium]
MTAPGAAAEVTRTLSEIAALTLKAVRGAGCRWSLAEEAAMAVRVLEAHGLPGVATLDEVLRHPRACPCTGAKEGARCAIAALAALGDGTATLAPQAPVDLPHTQAPMMLIAPLLLAARRLEATFVLTWAGSEVTCALDGLRGDAAPCAAARPRVTRLLARPTGPARGPDTSSRALPQGAWNRLTRLADATLVPETEASRASGAGPCETKED